MNVRWAVVGLVLVGCGDVQSGGGTVCEDAALLLAECLQMDVEMPSSCDAVQQAEAEALLGWGCEGLDPGKADDLNPEGRYDGDLATGARPGDPGYFDEIFAGSVQGTDEAPGFMRAVEEEFFERSADKVNEIQDFVACDASGGDWTPGTCVDPDGDVLELPAYDVELPEALPESAAGSRANKCAQLGGRWTAARCSDASAPRVEVRRGFHNKGHICARAGFKVLSDQEVTALVPGEDLEQLRVGGVFGEPGRVFGSWVRLSNGHPAQQDDGQPDFRGFAVKLLGVQGRQVLDGDPGFSVADTQDFLMLSNPMMAAPDAHTFMHFVDHGGPPNSEVQAALYAKRLGIPERILGIRANRYQDDSEFADHMLSGSKVMQHMAHFLAHRVFLGDPIGFLRSRPRGLESQPFFSGSSIRFGRDTTARYAVLPCASAAPDLECRQPDDRLRADGSLRGPLEERLGDGVLGDAGKGLRYRFFVQLQNDEGGTPLENASNEWRPEEAAMIPMADIILPPRPGDYASDAAESEAFCESLRFMPFHAVDAYEPVGSINRIRKFVYRASQDKRAGRTGDDSADVCFGFDCDVVSIIEDYASAE